MLSGGQKRRLCLGMALCGDSELLLLDEPSSGLDPRSQATLWHTLTQLKTKRKACLMESEMSMVLTTHHMQEAVRLCDRVAILIRGKLHSIGTPDQLCAQANQLKGLLIRIETPAARLAHIRRTARDFKLELLRQRAPSTSARTDHGLTILSQSPAYLDLILHRREGLSLHADAGRSHDTDTVILETKGSSSDQHELSPEKNSSAHTSHGHVRSAESDVETSLADLSLDLLDRCGVDVEGPNSLLCLRRAGRADLDLLFFAAHQEIQNDPLCM